MGPDSIVISDVHPIFGLTSDAIIISICLWLLLDSLSRKFRWHANPWQLWLLRTAALTIIAALIIRRLAGL